jgi:hypothetical protein
MRKKVRRHFLQCIVLCNCACSRWLRLQFHAVHSVIIASKKSVYFQGYTFADFYLEKYKLYFYLVFVSLFKPITVVSKDSVL